MSSKTTTLPDDNNNAATGVEESQEEEESTTNINKTSISIDHDNDNGTDPVASSDEKLTVSLQTQTSAVSNAEAHPPQEEEVEEGPGSDDKGDDNHVNGNDADASPTPAHHEPEPPLLAASSSQPRDETTPLPSFPHPPLQQNNQQPQHYYDYQQQQQQQQQQQPPQLPTIHNNNYYYDYASRNSRNRTVAVTTDEDNSSRYQFMSEPSVSEEEEASRVRAPHRLMPPTTANSVVSGSGGGGGNGNPNYNYPAGVFRFDNGYHRQQSPVPMQPHSPGNTSLSSWDMSPARQQQRVLLHFVPSGYNSGHSVNAASVQGGGGGASSSLSAGGPRQPYHPAVTVEHGPQGQRQVRVRQTTTRQQRGRSGSPLPMVGPPYPSSNSPGPVDIVGDAHHYHHQQHHPQQLQHRFSSSTNNNAPGSSARWGGKGGGPSHRLPPSPPLNRPVVPGLQQSNNNGSGGIANNHAAPYFDHHILPPHPGLPSSQQQQPSSSSSATEERRRFDFDDRQIFLHSLNASSDSMVYATTKTEEAEEDSKPDAARLPSSTTKQTRLQKKKKKQQHDDDRQQISNEDAFFTQSPGDTRNNKMDESVVMTFSDSDNDDSSDNGGIGDNEKAHRHGIGDTGAAATTPPSLEAPLEWEKRQAAVSAATNQEEEVVSAQQSLPPSHGRGENTRTDQTTSAQQQTTQSQSSSSSAPKQWHRRTRSGDAAAASLYTGGVDWKGMELAGLPMPESVDEEDDDDDEEEDRPAGDGGHFRGLNGSSGRRKGEISRPPMSVAPPTHSRRPSLPLEQKPFASYGFHTGYGSLPTTVPHPPPPQQQQTSPMVYPGQWLSHGDNSQNASNNAFVDPRSRPDWRPPPLTPMPSAPNNHMYGEPPLAFSPQNPLSAVSHEQAMYGSHPIPHRTDSWTYTSVNSQNVNHGDDVEWEEGGRQGIEAEIDELDYSDGDQPISVQQNSMDMQGIDGISLDDAVRRFDDHQFRGGRQSVLRPHVLVSDSPFANLGKKSTEKAPRSAFLPRTILSEEQANMYPTYICPNCKMRQRAFFSVSDAPSKMQGPSGYLAFYFTIYVVASLIIFGLEEGWAPMDCLYFAVITLTTAGLGDFVPTTNANKIICSIFIYFGVACIGLLLGSYIAGMLDDKARRDAKQRQVQSCPNCARLKMIREAAQKRPSPEKFVGSARVPLTRAAKYMSERPCDLIRESAVSAVYKPRHHNHHHHHNSPREASDESHQKNAKPGIHPSDRAENSMRSSGSEEVETAANPKLSTISTESNSLNRKVPQSSPPDRNEPTVLHSNHVMGSPMTREFIGRQSHTRHISLDINNNGAFWQQQPRTRRFSHDLMTPPPTITEGVPVEPPNSAPNVPFGGSTRFQSQSSLDSVDSSDDDCESTSTSSESSVEELMDERTGRIRAAKYVFLTLRLALVNSMVIIAVGCFGFWAIEGFTLVDSWYFTTVLLTTVGYGDICPVTSGGKLFATVYILVAGTVLLNNMSLISFIPLELRKRRIEHAVLTQFGDQLTDEALRELATGPVIKRLSLSIERPDGLAECTREMFSLAMLIRLGKVTEQDIKTSFAAFRRLDVNNEGVLNSKSIIAGMIQKHRAISSVNLRQSLGANIVKAQMPAPVAPLPPPPTFREEHMNQQRSRAISYDHPAQWEALQEIGTANEFSQHAAQRQQRFVRLHSSSGMSGYQSSNESPF